MVLGCSASGIPVACIAAISFGWRAGIGGWVVGGLISGVPFDKFLEGRCSILQVDPDV
jgi:hypothetical protein